ncbi:hypothetical protein TKK_0019115 [Trichogramma kaykai]|uniref:Uncharacterized protein n=1 Tax=Trichogramma kaykai TaxID=54128 RepID=A0ABD2VVJ6_9HYME
MTLDCNISIKDVLQLVEPFDGTNHTEFFRQCHNALSMIGKEGEAIFVKWLNLKLAPEMRRAFLYQPVEGLGEFEQQLLTYCSPTRKEPFKPVSDETNNILNDTVKTCPNLQLSVTCQPCMNLGHTLRDHPTLSDLEGCDQLKSKIKDVTNHSDTSNGDNLSQPTYKILDNTAITCPNLQPSVTCQPCMKPDNHLRDHPTLSDPENYDHQKSEIKDATTHPGTVNADNVSQENLSSCAIVNSVSTTEENYSNSTDIVDNNKIATANLCNLAIALPMLNSSILISKHLKALTVIEALTNFAISILTQLSNPLINKRKYHLVIPIT